jgi:WD40-like Beta Propeller Repeat
LESGTSATVSESASALYRHIARFGPMRLMKLIAIVGTLAVAFLVLSYRVIIRSIPSEARAHFLTMDPNATDYWPCFSPDGKTVLFSRTRDGGKTWELFVVPSSGGEARPFTRGVTRLFIRAEIGNLEKGTCPLVTISKASTASGPKPSCACYDRAISLRPRSPGKWDSASKECGRSTKAI